MPNGICAAVGAELSEVEAFDEEVVGLSSVVEESVLVVEEVLGLSSLFRLEEAVVLLEEGGSTEISLGVS